MDTAALDYELPPEAIAQAPVEPRDAARLLVDRGPQEAPAHHTVADLPTFVGPGDVVVVNDARVLPARLHLEKPTGGSVEVLLLEPLGDGTWSALIRPARRVRPGTPLRSASRDSYPTTNPWWQNEEVVEVCERIDERSWRVSVRGDAAEVMARLGEVPLPPYINRPLDDPERYQTVYARTPGAVAAPTAGLHLTDEVLDGFRALGAAVVPVHLDVGLDTFRPITAERVEDHEIHTEPYAVPAATLESCRSASRVVAIGTTTVRALEAAARTERLDGRADLFITPGYEFQVVDVLLTNFHVPRSSLLALVEAFIGPRWRALYDTALADGYRFLSLGDAMLLAPDGVP